MINFLYSRLLSQWTSWNSCKRKQIVSYFNSVELFNFFFTFFSFQQLFFGPLLFSRMKTFIILVSGIESSLNHEDSNLCLVLGQIWYFILFFLFSAEYSEYISIIGNQYSACICTHTHSHATYVKVSSGKCRLPIADQTCNCSRLQATAGAMRNEGMLCLDKHQQKSCRVRFI